MTWNLNLQDHGGQLISVVTVPSSSATPTSSPVPFEARCRISSSGLQAPAWPNLVLVLVLTLFFPVTLASECRQWSQYVSHFVFFQRGVMWASCSKWKFWFQSSARFSFPNEASYFCSWHTQGLFLRPHFPFCSLHTKLDLCLPLMMLVLLKLL